MKMPGEKDKIGRYEIIEEIGRGAMGVVYKARDPAIDRFVAIKVINLEGFTKVQAEEVKERFSREAQIAGKVQHQNLVSVYDVGEHEGKSFITMEYVDGMTLDVLLKARQCLEPDEAKRVVTDICNGLKGAHALGVIHRDIKPSNIILTQDDQAKLMDFGIAHVEDSTLTGKGTYLGSPAFMSPEQVLGRELDPRSDIFSIGILMYILLTGERPFPGENFNTVSYRIIREEPTPPSGLNILVPKGYDYITAKLLAKEPSERYSSTDEVIADLERVGELASEPTPAHEPVSAADADETIIEDRGGEAKPYRTTFILAILFLLLFLSLLTFALIRYDLTGKLTGKPEIKEPELKAVTTQEVTLAPVFKPATQEKGLKPPEKTGLKPETPKVTQEKKLDKDKKKKKKRRARKKTTGKKKPEKKKKLKKTRNFFKKIKKKIKRDK